MKKKLAFVIPSLDAGGGEKSLVNLLNTLDSGRFDVDLILLHERGIFLNTLPDFVNVITPKGDFLIFRRSLVSSIKAAISKAKFGLAINRVLFALKNQFIKKSSRAEQFSWPNVSRAIPPFGKRYDAAIGFLEKSSIYFTVEKLEAKTKVGFIHNDYVEIGMDADFDRPYFKKLEKIVTVSNECENVLKMVFPEFKDKISVMHNIVSPAFIERLSKSGNADDMAENSILSIGRLHPQKGFDMAIEACEILVKKGVDLRWYVIGEGNERQKLEAEIASKKLAGRFILLGLRENPYPYLKKARVYAQTSRFEGKSIAIDEAKILAKPIVVTNFSTVFDQITHLKNGYVADMSARSIAIGLETVLSDQNLRAKFSKNLSREPLGTEAEIEKLYDLIENR